MRFPIVTVIVLIIVFLLLYSYANNQAKETYKRTFDLCKQTQGSVDLSLYPQAQSCISSGGCFTPCISVCNPKPYFGLREISNIFNKQSCTQCVPYCMQAP